MAPTAIIAGNAAYTLGQIRGMADQLAQAREHGKFPKSTSSPMDVQFIVEDYNSLCELRNLHQNPSGPAPEAYHQLKIEITRRVQERDEAFDESSNQEEAARRVDTYLRSVEQERRYFDVTKTLLERRGVKVPTQLDLDNVGEEICSIVENVVEHVVEQSMADASAPLRTNIGRLNHQAADFQDQNDTYSRQLDLHYRNIEQHSAQCSDTIKALNAMFEPQAKNVQATTDSLVLASGLVGNLSQLVASLPSTINQVVCTTLQYQTQEAIKDVLEAQQQAMLSVQEQYRQERLAMEDAQRKMLNAGRQSLNVDALIESIKMEKPSRGVSRTGKGTWKRMVDRVFKRQG